MKTQIQSWHDRKESDLWLHEKVLHIDLQYAAQEIAELRQYCLELENRVLQQEPVIANQQAMNNSLRESVTGFLSVIQSADPFKLSRAVELGQTVWFIKIMDEIGFAEKLIAEHKVNSQSL